MTRTEGQNASTKLLTRDPKTLQETVGDEETGKQLIQKYCCGGGCCFLNAPTPRPTPDHVPIDLPDNDAFRSLNFKVGQVTHDMELNHVAEPASQIVSFAHSTVPTKPDSSIQRHPPRFVQPHPPYDVFSAPLFHARELTNPGAEKRTIHFDIDVTDYPAEGDVDFKVGGAIGVVPPNSQANVDEIFDLLNVPEAERDAPIALQTSQGRWPTIWGDDTSRTLQTTQRELLTWCSDIQSYPPTKSLFRLLADKATASNEKKILTYLCSAEGQPSFCDLRTGPHISVAQLLHAFPSSKPSLPSLLSVLNQLMPRFYSLSNDPHVSSTREGLAGRRIIEIAVTIHESPNWRGGPRTGVGSGYLERLAHQYIEHTRKFPGTKPDLRVPMFRGLMANPLSKEFGSASGPMMLIGAGVGMAPFRGFILNRVRSANCASKIWLIQGVRDSHLDELYSGELGAKEAEIKRVVQSRVAGGGHRGSSTDRHKRKKSTHRELASQLDREMRNCSENDLAALRQQAVRTHPLSPEVVPNDSTAAAAAPIVPEEIAPAQPPQTEPEEEDSAARSSRYVQDEVRQQADVVWDIVQNSVDGRIFVCGSSKGMGEGVESALRDVAIDKGGMDEEGARAFWEGMKGTGRYVCETW